MTAQFSEILHYKGEQLSMRVTPLSDYFVLMGLRPEFQDMSTACWRCYVGEWDITLDRLYLIGIRADYKDGTEVTLGSLFPGYDSRVFAHWYSGVLSILVPGLAFILVWLVWPVAIGFKFFEMYQKKDAEANGERLSKSKEFVLKQEALVREMTVAEIERANMLMDPLGAAPNLPFGHLYAVWVEFRDELGVGETLHLFESVGPNAFRKQLIWGYAVCKEGRVERFMTAGWRL